MPLASPAAIAAPAGAGAGAERERVAGAAAAVEGGEGVERGGVELPPHPPVAGGTEGVEGG